jgi:hypothetical protein
MIHPSLRYYSMPGSFINMAMNTYLINIGHLLPGLMTVVCCDNLGSSLRRIHDVVSPISTAILRKDKIPTSSEMLRF